MHKHPSSSRFNGAATGFLHALPRRASAQYVDRSIRVRMGAVSAIDTAEVRLALAASAVDGPAFCARLRSIGGVDEMKLSAPLGELVFQHGHERTCGTVGKSIHDQRKVRREIALKRAEAAIRFFMKPDNADALAKRREARAQTSQVQE